ncbi:hypothetical protein M0804_001271 [Polistes exclamans]|nr:hypothetical protein M0804_001271 [Polistes exclamans]
MHDFCCAILSERHCLSVTIFHITKPEYRNGTGTGTLAFSLFGGTASRPHHNGHARPTIAARLKGPDFYDSVQVVVKLEFIAVMIFKQTACHLSELDKSVERMEPLH